MIVIFIRFGVCAPRISSGSSNVVLSLEIAVHAPANNFPLRQHKAAPTCTGDIFPSHRRPVSSGFFKAVCIVGAIHLFLPAVLQENGRVI